MSEHYEVHALKYARMENRMRGNNFLFDDRADAPSPIEFFVWVIRNDARTILVDTGFESREAAARGREIEIEPAAALAAIGIAPESITTCILTHLHFDHAGGLHQFENANIHLQAPDARYSRSQSARSDRKCWGPSFTNQVRHLLSAGSPWERIIATSRLRRDAACGA